MQTITEEIRFEGEVGQQKHPATVVLMVNDRAACNISCTHCYLPYKGARSPEDVLQLVKKLKIRFEKVMIAGSEPLLNVEYLKAYQVAGQKHLLTNGIALNQNPELFDQLHQYGIEELQISLHFGIQTSLGSVPRHIVEKVAREAIERGFTVQISVTITSENYRGVENMCKETHAIGVQAIKFIHYVKSGSAHEDNQMELTTNQKDEFFSLVDLVRKEYQKSALDVRIHGNFGPKKGSKGEKMAECNAYCPAGSTLFTIDPNDNVYGCPFLMEHPIGRIDSDAILIERDPFNGIRDICRTCLLSALRKKNDTP